MPFGGNCSIKVQNSGVFSVTEQLNYHDKNLGSALQFIDEKPTNSSAVDLHHKQSRYSVHLIHKS